MGFANTALIIAVQTSVAWGEPGHRHGEHHVLAHHRGRAHGQRAGGVLLLALAHGSIPEETASRVLTAEGMRSLDPAVVARVSDGIALGVGWITGSWLPSPASRF